MFPTPREYRRGPRVDALDVVIGVVFAVVLLAVAGWAKYPPRKLSPPSRWSSPDPARRRAFFAFPFYTFMTHSSPGDGVNPQVHATL
jgi:hypothetical protein